MGDRWGKETVLWGCAPQDSLITLKTSLPRTFFQITFPMFFPNLYKQFSAGMVRYGLPGTSASPGTGGM